MASMHKKRLSAIEARRNPATGASWVRVIDYGEDATDEQRQKLAEGIAKAKADGLNVIRRLIHAHKMGAA